MTPEPDAHAAAEQPHANLDPARAARIEVLHQRSARAPDEGWPVGSSSAVLALGRVAGAACGEHEPVMGMMRSAAGGCMPSSVRATISTRCGVS